MNTDNTQDNKHEDILDVNNPHFVHNVFMRNARVWTDNNDWCMTIDTFKKVISEYFQLLPSQQPKIVSEEEIEKMAAKEFPYNTDSVVDRVLQDGKRRYYIQGYKAALQSK